MVVERAQQVIDAAAKERAKFIEWVRSVPPESWSKVSPDGRWQARDYVAHLASTDPLLTGLMRTFQRDGSFDAGSGAAQRFSIDEWNEGQMLKRRVRFIEEL